MNYDINFIKKKVKPLYLLNIQGVIGNNKPMKKILIIPLRKHAIILHAPFFFLSNIFFFLKKRNKCQ